MNQAENNMNQAEIFSLIVDVITVIIWLYQGWVFLDGFFL